MAVKVASLQPFTNVPELQPFLKKNVKQTSLKLGNGSFGVVEELIVNGTSCAGKKLHEELLDPEDQGITRLIERFVSECNLMSTIRHPNVVQFIGLCHFEGSTHPILIMERLPMSLEELITKANKRKETIPLSLNMSIATDVAQGLVYLHDHKIAHRDLTSRNVLLTLSMQAKIADLGNALIIGPQTLTKTMTRVPGTAVYMPPEATEVKPLYGTAIDMFSYGQLMLYTVTQEFPSAMLAPTYTDPASRQLLARSEIERRKPYFDKLHKVIRKDHLLSKITFQCLQNLPEMRPSAATVLENLQKAPEEMLRSVSDEYHQYSTMSKLELVRLLRESKQSNATQGTHCQCEEPSSVAQPETSDYISPSKLPWTLSEQKQNGVPGQLELVKSSKTGSIRRGSKRSSTYHFQISNSTHLRYFDLKTKGEVKISDISSVESLKSYHPSGFKFRITFNENLKEAPWTLCAQSEVERSSWMEALTPPSDYYHIAPVQNVAYQLQNADVMPPKSRAQLPLPVVPSAVTGNQSQPLSDSSTKAASSKEADAANSKYLKEAHYYTKIPSPPAHTEETDLYTYTDMNTGSSVSVPLATSTSTNAQQQVQSSVPSSTNAPIYTQQQVSMLIQMLQKHPSTFKQTKQEAMLDDYTGYENDDNSGPEEVKSAPAPTVFSSGCSKPKVKETESTKDSLGSTMQQTDEKRVRALGSSPKRPSDLSIKTPSPQNGDSPHNIEELYDVIPSPESQGLPSLVIESPQNELPNMAAKANKKTSTKTQSGLLDPDLIKSKLDRILGQTSTDSLLITDDESDNEEERPEWARASTGTTPIPSPQPQEGTLSMLRQHLLIKRIDLQNHEQIGQGNFGKVHRATLKLKSGSSVTVVAKTMIKYQSEQEMGDFFHEMGVMSEMMHPNIIHLYGIIKEEPPTIVVEYFPNRDLKSYLKKNKRSVDQLVRYMIDIAMGMHYIAEKGLIHRDLAARNVMVSDNETCKVADFGLLRELPKDDSIYHAKTSIAWPIRWMAPESLTDRDFSSASDVWSFGILLWEMLFPDVLPYSDLDVVQCATKVCAGYRLAIPQDYPSTVRKIMKACWLKKAEKRPSFPLISTMLTNMAIHGN